jgi:pimeloyl-ACP methyl ester carboxylesterase
VAADDGVRVHVEEVGPAGRRAVPSFCHGYTQQMAVWHYQRRRWPPTTRAASSSGTSAPTAAPARPPENSTIDQLGRDLHAVLDEVVPRGPVVLVGHSMGGMTIMALADRTPSCSAPASSGVALLATSTGKLAEVTFGLPGRRRRRSTRGCCPSSPDGAPPPGVFERGRRLGTDLAFVLTRREAFGDQDVSPALVQFVEQMTARTRIDVIAEFYDTFTTHDKLAALERPARRRGRARRERPDLITPPDHSEAMPGVPTAARRRRRGAGHMVRSSARA